MFNEKPEVGFTLATRKSWEQVGGAIPVEVVAELFERMQLSKDLQGQFFQVAKEKEYHEISGKVTKIKTNRDGSTQVCVGSTATGGVPGPNDPIVLTNYFYGPGGFSDAQLDEFKRAQSDGLCVKVTWQVENGVRQVNSVEVFPCP